MRRKRLIVGAAVLAVAIATTAGVLVVQRQRAAAPKDASTPAQVSTQTGQVIVEGRMQARTLVPVGPPISGTLEVLHVSVGDDVFEGQLLGEVRSDTLEAAEQSATLELERAQTRVNNLESSIAAARLEASRASADAQRARSEFDRLSRAYTRQKLLLAEGATPRQVFEKTEKEFKALESESKSLTDAAASAEERVSGLNRDLDAARKVLEGRVADLESAKARVAAGQIVSPATGVLSGIRGAAGDEVNPEIRDLFQIATDTSVMDVMFDMSPDQARLIQIGTVVGVITADTADEALPGKVTKVEGTKVTAEFGNPSPLVKPGQTARVRLELR